MNRIIKMLAGSIVHLTEAYTNTKVVSGTLTIQENGVFVGRTKLDNRKVVEIRIRKDESPELYVETKNSKRFLEQSNTTT